MEYTIKIQKIHADARKYEELTFMEVLDKDLKNT